MPPPGSLGTGRGSSARMSVEPQRSFRRGFFYLRRRFWYRPAGEEVVCRTREDIAENESELCCGSAVTLVVISRNRECGKESILVQ